MSLYIYKASDPAGKLIEDTFEADSALEVVDFINKEGLLAISVELKKEKKDNVKHKAKAPLFSQTTKIKKTDVAVFCRQMATMLNAGVIIADAISSIELMTLNPKLKKILKEVAVSLNDGEALSDSFAKYPQTFGKIFIPMIRVGEAGGNLDTVFEDLANYTEDAADMQRKIKAASMYPIVITAFMGFIITGVILFLVPQFKELFESLGGELPFLTSVAINISDMVIDNILFVFFLISVVIILAKVTLNNKKGRFIVESLVLKTPVLGEFMEKIFIARFFHSMSVLLKCGVGILESLDIAKNVVASLPYEYGINSLKTQIAQGSCLSDEMNKSPLFTTMAVGMVSVGEQSGAMPQTLEKVSEYYNKHISAKIEGISSIIEPILIIFLGVVVGLFVVVMYLPIFGMAAAMMGG